MARTQNKTKPQAPPNISGPDTANRGEKATEWPIWPTIDPEWYRELLERGLDDAESGTGLQPLAERLFDEEADALRPFARFCAIDRMLLDLRRIRIERARKMQLRLPGFEAIPQRLPRSDGKGRRGLLQATYRDLYRFRLAMVAKAKGSPKLLQVEALLKLMRKHPTHGITVGEVLDLEGIQPKLFEP